MQLLRMAKIHATVRKLLHSHAYIFTFQHLNFNVMLAGDSGTAITLMHVMKFFILWKSIRSASGRREILKIPQVQPTVK